MIKHIIFDFFGTISDTGTSSVDATAQILVNVGSSLDPAVFYNEWKTVKRVRMDEEPFYTEKEHYARILCELFEKYGIDADGRKEVKPYIDMLFGDRKVFPDAKACIEELKAMGLDVVIGSTTDNDVLEHHLHMYGIVPDDCFTSEDFNVYKPHPEFYRSILEKTGWASDECLFIGDSLGDDVFGPRAEGMHAVWLNRKNKAYGDAFKSGTIKEEQAPDRIITSLSELPDAVIRMNSLR
ncbi:MAG: HAD family hydrolase [Firmicutes bacterium]|nr:HAD family hydrolase [Bacillota bacterium]